MRHPQKPRGHPTLLQLAAQSSGPVPLPGSCLSWGQISAPAPQAEEPWHSSQGATASCWLDQVCEVDSALEVFSNTRPYGTGH